MFSLHGTSVVSPSCRGRTLKRVFWPPFKSVSRSHPFHCTVLVLTICLSFFSTLAFSHQLHFLQPVMQSVLRSVGSLVGFFGFTPLNFQVLGVFLLYLCKISNKRHMMVLTSADLVVSRVTSNLVAWLPLSLITVISHHVAANTDLRRFEIPGRYYVVLSILAQWPIQSFVIFRNSRNRLCHHHVTKPGLCHLSKPEKFEDW